jgi:hypothetical protein
MRAEPGTSPDRHGGTWPLVLLLGLGVAAGLVAWLVLSRTGHLVRPWLVLALCVSGGMVACALRVLTVQVPSPSQVLPPLSRRVLTDRERGGVVRLARTIESGIESADRFDLRVRPVLIRLADHALRRRHGVDLRFEPERARELLGDSLWQIIRTPPTTPPPRPQVAEWVARLEAL